MKPIHYLYVGIGLAAVGAAIYLVKSGKMIMPLQGRITSGFGNRVHPVDGTDDFHNGIDISGSVGDQIVAPAKGVVKSIYSNSAGGNQLLIEHRNGFTSGYAHLSKYHVSQGDFVKKGQVIAEVGSTGKATGPHLHLTLKDRSGKFVDPINHLA